MNGVLVAYYLNIKFDLIKVLYYVLRSACQARTRREKCITVSAVRAKCKRQLSDLEQRRCRSGRGVEGQTELIGSVIDGICGDTAGAAKNANNVDVLNPTAEARRAALWRYLLAATPLMLLPSQPLLQQSVRHMYVTTRQMIIINEKKEAMSLSMTNTWLPNNTKYNFGCETNSCENKHDTITTQSIMWCELTKRWLHTMSAYSIRPSTLTCRDNSILQENRILLEVTKRWMHTDINLDTCCTKPTGFSVLYSLSVESKASPNTAVTWPTVLRIYYKHLTTIVHSSSVESEAPPTTAVTWPTVLRIYYKHLTTIVHSSSEAIPLANNRTINRATHNKDDGQVQGRQVSRERAPNPNSGGRNNERARGLSGADHSGHVYVQHKGDVQERDRMRLHQSSESTVDSGRRELLRSVVRDRLLVGV
ncbi:hypothetical protein J6590_051875 [Homalodisca vitripennis]|nr:hypothetical protein J6590_051875 [Homalodisca vitripennis]